LLIDRREDRFVFLCAWFNIGLGQHNVVTVDMLFRDIEIVCRAQIIACVSALRPAW